MSEKLWVDDAGTMHELCTIMFVVGNDILGIREVDPGEMPDIGYRRGGTVYVCATCGQAWGWIIMVDSKGQQTPFAEIARIACEKHHDPYEIPGSLLGGYRNHAYLRHLTPMAAKREFIIHHNRFYR